jgi:hypothetical protein
MVLFHGHHLDGLSTFMLAEELLQYYQPLINQDQSEAVLLSVKADVGQALLSRWPAKVQASTQALEQIASGFYRQHRGMPEALGAMGQLAVTIDNTLYQQVVDTQVQGYTFTEMVGSCFASVVADHDGAVMLNTVVNRRDSSAIENLIGDFSSALPLVIERSSDQPDYTVAPLDQFHRRLSRLQGLKKVDGSAVRQKLAELSGYQAHDPRVFGRFGLDSIDRENLLLNSQALAHELPYEKLTALMADKLAILDLLLVIIKNKTSASLLFMYNSACFEPCQIQKISEQILDTLAALVEEVVDAPSPSLLPTDKQTA